MAHSDSIIQCKEKSFFISIPREEELTAVKNAILPEVPQPLNTIRPEAGFCNKIQKLNLQYM